MNKKLTKSGQRANKSNEIKVQLQLTNCLRKTGHITQIYMYLYTKSSPDYYFYCKQ